MRSCVYLDLQYFLCRDDLRPVRFDGTYAHCFDFLHASRNFLLQADRRIFLPLRDLRAVRVDADLRIFLPLRDLRAVRVGDDFPILPLRKS